MALRAPWRLMILTLMLLAAIPLVGCTYTKVTRDGWATFRELADPPRNARQLDPNAGQPLQGWAILLEAFEGDNQDRNAVSLARFLQRDMHVPDIYTLQRGKQTLVLRGRYPEPNVDAAERDLRQTRMLLVDGHRPYAEAQIIQLNRPVTTGSAEIAQLDLAPHKGALTLQMGFYDEAFGPEFRKAAEQAAVALRRDGVLAFFYHGPNRSLVTIGLFDESDQIQISQKLPDGSIHIQPTYSQRVKNLQEQFPYNLGNGRTLIERRGDERLGEQPSFLVRVPR